MYLFLFGFNFISNTLKSPPTPNPKKKLPETKYYLQRIHKLVYMFFTECLSYSELFNICIMHSAWYMYQGINSKFVFKIALSSSSLGGSCNVTYLFSWLRQAFGSSFHAPRWPLRITMSASCPICLAQIFFWKNKRVLLLSDYNFYLHCGYLC